MKKMHLLICLVLTLFLTACAEWDLIGRGAVEAFDRIINTEQRHVASSTSNHSWRWFIAMPDGSASFGWGRETQSYFDSFELSLTFDGQPFIEAGLDGDKLEEGIHLFNRDDWGGILLTANLGTAGSTEVSDINSPIPIRAFEQLIHANPEILAYHDTGHHYMLHLGDSGHMIMFARDVTTQEAGFVFMLNPQPFIDAGTDVHNIAGWSYEERETMTMRGSTLAQYFLVKTFDLK